MTTRSPRAPRTPLRVGVLARRRLERLGRRDAATAGTPTVQAIQAHADAYARREEQRFFSRMHRELVEYSVLTRTLDADLSAYDDRLSSLDAPDRQHLAEASGPVYEEIRRLERRIARTHRRTDELSALIQSRFTAAKLRAARYYDRSDEKVALYWGAYRAVAGRSENAPLQRPAALDRAGWLTTPDHTTVLERWRRRTDVRP